jgi:hypothetical protein
MLILLPVFVLQVPPRRALSTPAMQNWMTVFVALVIQALPFLVLVSCSRR